MQRPPRVRRLVKSLAALALVHSGVSRLLASRARRAVGGCRVLILGYHRVVPDFALAAAESIPSALVSQQTLRLQLVTAREAGFRFASLEEALSVLSGRTRSRRDLLVVTFDDGYRDVHRYALPVLEELGVPATVYVATGLVGTTERFLHDRLHHLLQRLPGKPPLAFVSALSHTTADLVRSALNGRGSGAAIDAFIARHPATVVRESCHELEQLMDVAAPPQPEWGEVMSWDEIRALARAGVGLGAHTVNHVVLPHEPEEVVFDQLRRSRAQLERETGADIVDFAYCNGWYSAETTRLVQASGFRSAVTTEDLPNSPGQNPYALRRKVLWEAFSQGHGRRSSVALTRCHLEGSFAALGLHHPVRGLLPQRQARMQTFQPSESGTHLPMGPSHFRS